MCSFGPPHPSSPHIPDLKDPSHLPATPRAIFSSQLDRQPVWSCRGHGGPGPHGAPREWPEATEARLKGPRTPSWKQAAGPGGGGGGGRRLIYNTLCFISRVEAQNTFINGAFFFFERKTDNHTSIILMGGVGDSLPCLVPPTTQPRAKSHWLIPSRWQKRTFSLEESRSPSQADPGGVRFFFFFPLPSAFTQSVLRLEKDRAASRTPPIRTMKGWGIWSVRFWLRDTFFFAWRNFAREMRNQLSLVVLWPHVSLDLNDQTPPPNWPGSGELHLCCPEVQGGPLISPLNTASRRVLSAFTRRRDTRGRKSNAPASLLH